MARLSLPYMAGFFELFEEAKDQSGTLSVCNAFGEVERMQRIRSLFKGISFRIFGFISTKREPLKITRNQFQDVYTLAYLALSIHGEHGDFVLLPCGEVEGNACLI